MSKSDSQKIIIVGAGIAGLTAALCLRQTGRDITVLEQAPALQDIGAGIQLSPNALHVLNAINVSDRLEAKADTPTEVSIRDFKSGTPLLTQKMGATFNRRYGAGYWHCHRADLIEALSNAAQEAGIDILFNEKIVAYEETPDTVFVKTQSGKNISADLLIGADGISSTIRSTLHPNNTADFTGQIAWRGLVPTEQLKMHLNKQGHKRGHKRGHNQVPEGVNVWVGPGKHFVAYRLRQASLMNFIAVEERAAWTEENWMLEGDINKLRTAFSAWDSPVQDILEACTETYLWGLFDRPAPKTWHSSRTVLIGDACHPILPFMAQGAAMAIEDAYVLASSLENKTSIEAGLNLFQQKRQNRVKNLYDISRRNAALYHASGIKAAARNTLFAGARMFPKALSYLLDRVYGLNVTE